LANRAIVTGRVAGIAAVGSKGRAVACYSRQAKMRKRWLVMGLAAVLVVAVGSVWRMRKMRALPSLGAKPAAVATARVPVPLDVGELMYDGSLGAGWEDWGWGAHELGKGPAQIAFASYGGILFHHSPLPSRYGGVSFRYKAPPAWGEFLHVTLMSTGAPEDAFPAVNVEPGHVAVVAGWREVLIPWQEVNPNQRAFDGVRIGSRRLVDAEPVLLDKVMLTKPSATAVGAGAKNAALRVLCAHPARPINPQIYGNSTDDWTSGQSIKRIGGNPLSRKNWELGYANSAKDWYFENNGENRSAFDWLDSHRKAKQPLAMVVPMLGWVAKDGSSFGFPRAKFGAQQSHDPHKPEAGNGVAPDGRLLEPGDPSSTSVPAPPELIEKWIAKLREQDLARGARAVSMYILDNEPALWNVTHRDVHPKPVSYDELLDRTIKYATAIRSADPEAVIAGPAEWGWPGYFTSAVDREPGQQVDRKAHGGQPLIAWYLKQLAAQERSQGKRLLNVLDLHFYPQAQGVFSDSGSATDPVTSELRLRSTRALWDSTYADESWINEAVRLIPRMKDWVRDNYPGTKLSIGEWSFGAEDHISGGLAAAEALGRFGQQGLDSAFHWGELKPGTPAYWAFRAFRDYDGQGSGFGSESLSVNEGEHVSLFASRDTGASKLVLVLINRSAESAIDARVDLDGCGNVAASRLFGYGSQSSELAEGKLTTGNGQVVATLPPYTMSVIELKLVNPSTDP
jgi:hypothetical protein